MDILLVVIVAALLIALAIHEHIREREFIIKDSNES